MVLANNNNEQGDTYCNSNNNDNIDYLAVVCRCVCRGINSGVSNIISGVNSSKSIVVTVVIH